MLNFPSATDSKNNGVVADTWQVAIKQLYSNFFVIESLLSRSAGLPTGSLRQYEAMQLTIVSTLEKLLTEIDQLEKRNTQRNNSCQVLKQHTQIINQLNTRVNQLIGEATA